MSLFKRRKGPISIEEWNTTTWVSEDRTAVWVGLVILTALFIWRLCM